MLVSVEEDGQRETDDFSNGVVTRDVDDRLVRAWDGVMNMFDNLNGFFHDLHIFVRKFIDPSAYIPSQSCVCRVVEVGDSGSVGVVGMCAVFIEPRVDIVSLGGPDQRYGEVEVSVDAELVDQASIGGKLQIAVSFERLYQRGVSRNAGDSHSDEGDGAYYTASIVKLDFDKWISNGMSGV